MKVDFENKDTFWKSYYEDFSKNIFKPYMEDKLAGFGKKLSMYYAPMDDSDEKYALDFDIEGMDFGIVSLINGICNQLLIDMGKRHSENYFYKTHFHGQCLFRVVFNH